MDSHIKHGVAVPPPTLFVVDLVDVGYTQPPTVVRLYGRIQLSRLVLHLWAWSNLITFEPIVTSL